MSATYLAALGAVLRVTHAEFDSAQPDEQALRRRELAEALRAAGFVHLDRALIEALRRGMRGKASRGTGTMLPRANMTRAGVSHPTSASVRPDTSPFATSNEGVEEAADSDSLDDAEPLDALDEMEGADAETGETEDNGA